MTKSLQEIVITNEDLSDFVYKIKQAKFEGHEVYCDFKLHDIHTTVKRALDGLKRLEVDFVSVHYLCLDDLGLEKPEGFTYDDIFTRTPTPDNIKPYVKIRLFSN